MSTRCLTCGGNDHSTQNCKFRDVEARFSKPEEEPAAEEGTFVPLRKKLKRASTGEEDNFMESYYTPSHSALLMSEEEAELLREEHGIEVEGGLPIPKPVTAFSDLGIPLPLLNQMQLLGYNEPTPIQIQSIPCSLSGRDVIGLAETGSGKTLCYVLPLIMFIKDQPITGPGQGPLALILAPTRELVEQIWSEVDKFLSPHRNPYLPALYAASQPDESKGKKGYQPRRVHYHRFLGVVGGVPLHTQASPIQNTGVDIIVATPGRLIDMLDKRIVSLDRLSYLVFDEADRMLSMNMEEQLRKIVTFAGSCPRQTLMFTATMPISVVRLARSAVLNPVTIKVGAVGKLASSVNHKIIFVHSAKKKQKLLEVLRTIPKPPVLVFCNGHHTVDNVVQMLREEQFHAAGIHSMKVQEYRFRAMRAFKEGQLDILVGTDLISRGIDVIDCKNVIIYDMPDSIEDYVHRSGRTGRFGTEGLCTAFLTYECTIARELRRLLRDSDQPIPKELEDSRVFGGQVIKTEFGDVPQRVKLFNEK